MAHGPEDDDFGTEGIVPTTMEDVIDEHNVEDTSAIAGSDPIDAMADLEAEAARLD